jgi:PRTRC genetic system ThiF family protein
MKFTKEIPVKIVVIGAGGTGGYVIPHLYRICFASQRPTRVIVCDGDIVERKNLIRQNFIAQDIGENKAKVLADRYSAAFGFEAEYVPSFIENEESLLKLIEAEKYHGELRCKVILIGAVDNNRSRQICHNAFLCSENLVYIDSGNGESTGQVVCGVRQNSRTMYKPVCSVFKDLLELDEDDKLPSEMSCAERAVSAPQSVTANLMAATAVTSFLYNLLIVGELRTRYITFSANLINMRAEVVKPRKKIIKKREVA